MNIGLILFLAYVLGMLIVKGVISIPIIQNYITNESSDEANAISFVIVVLWPFMFVIWIFLLFFSWAVAKNGNHHGEDGEDIHI